MPARKDPSQFVVPIEVLAGFFFVLIALMFVGPGQELGRRFARVEQPGRWPTRRISWAA